MNINNIRKVLLSLCYFLSVSFMTDLPTHMYQTVHERGAERRNFVFGEVFSVGVRDNKLAVSPR